MFLPLRNLKIINCAYRTNLVLQQCTVKNLKALRYQQQEVNNFQLNSKTNSINRDSVPVIAYIRKLLKLEKYLQVRHYANFSTKPAEAKQHLRKETGNENDGDEDKKQMPSHGHGRTLPRLMNFPEIIWPSMLNTIKNWIMVQFIIRPYMDREFNIKDFCYGAKIAMQLISSKLVNGDFLSLDKLVTPEALTELKSVVQNLSVSQRRQLEVKESDIYLTFPYQIGILFDESNKEVQKRWVEITMVFHILRGLKDLRESGEDIPWNMGTSPEYQDRVFVCNYRFIKEFTNGNESDWTVNVVNHFKPIDLINELKRE